MKNFSVVIPTFRRKKQTIKTIDLILKSKGLNKEFNLEAIVADSSPDNELKNALVDKFGSKIVYTRPQRPGIAANKNQGAKIAHHPILIFCDSDIEVEKWTIFNTLKALERHETAAAIGGQVIWHGGAKDGKYDRPRTEDRMVEIKETIYIEALYSRYFVTYRKVFFDVGGYDKEVFNMRGEGADLSARYWRAGYPLIYEPSIVVQHIHQVEGGIIRGTSHPEWGIAKDLLLFAYKYDILADEDENFAQTVAANFKQFDDRGYYRIVQGIGKNLDFIEEAKPIIDRQKKKMKPLYDFKFLEVFSKKKLFEKCIREAKKRLVKTRKEAF